MSPLRTFVVEDSPLVRDRLIDTLEELAPVRVIGHAADAAMACDRLAELEEPCDLVIVDLMLRGGSGFDVLQRLRDTAHAAHRVVLSNWATPYARQRCLQLGAHQVFDKSCQVLELVDLCAELASRLGSPDDARQA